MYIIIVSQGNRSTKVGVLGLLPLQNTMLLRRKVGAARVGTNERQVLMNLHINETGIENLNIYNSNIDDVDILYAAWHIICEVYAAIKNHTTNPVYECDYDDMMVVNNLREALNSCAIHGSKAAITTISFLRKQIPVEKLGECINMLFDEWSKYNKTMPEPTMAYCNRVFKYAINKCN